MLMNPTILSPSPLVKGVSQNLGKLSLDRIEGSMPLVSILVALGTFHGVSISVDTHGGSFDSTDNSHFLFTN